MEEKIRESREDQNETRNNRGNKREHLEREKNGYKIGERNGIGEDKGG